MNEEILDDALVNEEMVVTPPFNPIRIKKQAKTIGISLVALVLCSQLLSVIPSLVINLLVERGLDATLGMWLTTDCAIYVIGLPVYYLIIKNLPVFPPTKSEEKWSIKKWLLILIITFGLMYTTNLLAQYLILGLNTLFGVDTTDTIGQAINSTSNIYTFIFVVLLAPIGEEFIFRKLLMDRLLNYGEAFAILYSALAFGMFHCNIAQTLYASVIGLCLGYVYAKSGKIYYSMILHFIINLLGSFLFPLLINTPQGIIIGTIIIYIVIAAGLLLLYLNRKKIVLNQGELPISFKEKCKYGFITPGFITYAIIVLAFIVIVYVSSIIILSF